MQDCCRKFQGQPFSGILLPFGAAWLINLVEFPAGFIPDFQVRDVWDAAVSDSRFSNQDFTVNWLYTISISTDILLSQAFSIIVQKEDRLGM